MALLLFPIFGAVGVLVMLGIAALLHGIDLVIGSSLMTHDIARGLAIIGIVLGNGVGWGAIAIEEWRHG
jgi:hypothetical protein